VPIYEIVELGNAVPQRAADAVAKRDATVHAAGRLPVERFFDQLAVDLVPIANPIFDRPMLRFNSRVLQKSGGVAHSR
jgi:hypothetical protein